MEFLNTDIDQGLTLEEVKKRQAKFGLNELKHGEKFSWYKSFFAQFKDFMIILLLIAAIVSFGVAIYEHVHAIQKASSDATYEFATSEIVVGYIEPIIILIVVALNSMLGTYQEYKSNLAVKALEKNNELNAKVIREGKMMLIPSRQLTIGDIIVVEAGDYIAADAKLLQAFNLNVVESLLTGEALAVSKRVLDQDLSDKPLGDQINAIFSGTYVTNGRGVAIVTKIAQQTEIGKINQLILEQELPLTPLQIKLNKLSKIFGISGIILLFLTTILQVVLNGTFSNSWSDPQIYSSAFVIGISLAVAAIPEGLITFTTVLLAFGVSAMTKEHAIIKAFQSIETLGSTQIICSDKTGTLTENKMKVVEFFEWNQNNPQVLDQSKGLSYFVACCDAEVNVDENGEFQEVGDPTETGILRFGIDNKIFAKDFFTKNTKLASLPFDSDRKMMSVLVQQDNHNLIITKGAPDVIFKRVMNLPKEATELNEKWSAQSYRVIALAIKQVQLTQKTISFNDEEQLTFVGLIAMIDPPRSSVKHSIEQASSAGIKTVMITGDHLTTAVAIASNLGIYKEGDLAINGEELAQMSDEKLQEKVKEISVYARVNPSDKLRIVKAWQFHNQVVAMTGDGVNDAPALKAADVGCAMGITGTDVSKQAADVILTDDNFNTIVKAVKSGRETYEKIKTIILNMLVSSVSELFVMLIGLFVFRFVFQTQIGGAEFWVLSASQLLWINLLTHGLPAIALGVVPLGYDVMGQKPLDKHDSVFANKMGLKLIVHASVVSLFALLSYGIVGLIAKDNGIFGKEFVQLTSTATFVTLGIGTSINAINLMSEKSLFVCSFKTYYLVWAASLFSLVCVILSTYVPGFNSVFRNVNLKIYSPSWLLWGLPIFFGFGMTLYSEISKLFNNVIFKKQIFL